MREMQSITTGKEKCNGAVPRIEKAFRLVGKVTITDKILGYASVESEKNPGKFYNVCWKTKDCNCGDCTYRHVVCAHIRAVLQFVEMNPQ